MTCDRVWDQRKSVMTRITRERSGKNYRPGIIGWYLYKAGFREIKKNSALVCFLLRPPAIRGV